MLKYRGLVQSDSQHNLSTTCTGNSRRIPNSLMAFNLGRSPVIARNLPSFQRVKCTLYFSLGNHRSFHTELREHHPTVRSLTNLLIDSDVACILRNVTDSIHPAGLPRPRCHYRQSPVWFDPLRQTSLRAP